MDLNERKVALKEFLIRYFSLGDLRNLCFDLGFNHQDIPGDTISERSVELIEYALKYNRMNDLEREVQQSRPDQQFPYMVDGGKYAISAETIQAYLTAIASYIPAPFEPGRGSADDADITRAIWEGPYYTKILSPTLNQPRQKLVDLVNEKFFSVAENRSIGGAFMLVGEHGSGKTYAFLELRRLLGQQALESPPQDEAPARFLPLYLSLADVSQNVQIETLLMHAMNQMLPATAASISLDDVDTLLNTHACLILMDDLDKISYDHDQSYVQQVRQFIQTHPETYFVISTRSLNKSGQLGSMELYELDKLTDEEIKRIIQNLQPKLGSFRYDGQPLHTTPLKVARNRTLLEIIVKVLAAPTGKALIWNRGVLLRQRSRDILQRKEAREQFDIDQYMIEDLLENLAYRMHLDRTYQYTETQLIDFLHDYLEGWGDPGSLRRFVYILRDSDVLVCEPDRHRQWSFHDRITQAYFSAACIAQDERKITDLLNYSHDYWWRDLIEILLGLVDDPTDILYKLMDIDPVSAARSVQGSGISVSRELINSLIDVILETFLQERSSGRLILIKVLCEVCRPPLNLLWDLLFYEVRSNVLAEIARAIADPSLHTHTDDRLYPNNRDIQAEIQPEMLDAVHKIMFIWRDRIQGHTQNTAEVVEELAVFFSGRDESTGTNYDERVQGIAAFALGAIGTQDAQALLMDKLQSSTRTEFVLWCSADALSTIKNIQLDIVEDLALLFRKPKTRRVFAVYLMGWIGRRPAFKSERTNWESDLVYSIQDTRLDSNIRGHATHSLGNMEATSARVQLEEILRENREPNDWVQRRMIETLGKIGTPESIPILELYRYHERARTRKRVQLAISAIEQRFS